MSTAEIRQRSRPEVVFVLMKLLLARRLFWGPGGTLSLGSIGPLLNASPGQLTRALSFLCEEGMVLVDRRQGLVQLTDRGLRELLH